MYWAGSVLFVHPVLGDFDIWYFEYLHILEVLNVNIMLNISRNLIKIGNQIWKSVTFYKNFTQSSVMTSITELLTADWWKIWNILKQEIILEKYVAKCGNPIFGISKLYAE